MIKLSVQVSYKKQATLGIIGIVILLFENNNTTFRKKKIVYNLVLSWSPSSKLTLTFVEGVTFWIKTPFTQTHF